MAAELMVPQRAPQPGSSVVKSSNPWIHRALAGIALIGIYFLFMYMQPVRFPDAHLYAGSNESDYIGGAVQMRLAWESGERSIFFYMHPKYHMAPVMLLAAQAVFAFTDHSLASLRELNYLYFGLLLLVVYALARQMFGHTTAVLAALLLAAFPASSFVFPFYNQLMLTGIFLVLTLAVLNLSEGFSKPGWSALAGLCMAGAMLSHRGSPLMIMAPALLIYGLWAIMRHRSPKMILGIALFALLSLLPTYRYLLFYYGSHVAMVEKELHIGVLENPETLYFVRSLTIDQLYILIGLFWIPAVIWLAWVRRKDVRVWALLACAALPVFSLALFDTKNPDFIYPVVPALAVVISGAASVIRKPWFRRTACAYLSVAALMSCVLTPLLRQSDSDSRLQSSLTGLLSRFPAITEQSKMIREYTGRAPGMSETCENLLEISESRGPDEAVLVYVVKSDDGYLLSRDLMACVWASRIDLPAAQIEIRPKSLETSDEVWIFGRGSTGFDVALDLAQKQKTAQPITPVVNENFPETLKPLPPRPTQLLHVLPGDSSGPVLVYGYLKQ